MGYMVMEAVHMEFDVVLDIKSMCALYESEIKTHTLLITRVTGKTGMSYLPSNLWYRTHQIPNFNCFLSRLVYVFAQSIEAKYNVENEDVVGAAPTGDAPTTSEWSTILLPTMLRLVLEIARYIKIGLLGILLQAAGLVYLKSQPKWNSAQILFSIFNTPNIWDTEAERRIHTPRY